MFSGDLAHSTVRTAAQALYSSEMPIPTKLGASGPSSQSDFIASGARKVSFNPDIQIAQIKPDGQIARLTEVAPKIIFFENRRLGEFLKLQPSLNEKPDQDLPEHYLSDSEPEPENDIAEEYIQKVARMNTQLEVARSQASAMYRHVRTPSIIWDFEDLAQIAAIRAHSATSTEPITLNQRARARLEYDVATYARDYPKVRKSIKRGESAPQLWNGEPETPSVIRRALSHPSLLRCFTASDTKDE